MKDHRVARDLKCPLIQASVCMLFLNHPCQCLFSLLLKSSNGGDTITSMGSLFHSLIVLTVWKLLLRSNLNQLCCNLKLLLHVWPSVARENSQSFSLFSMPAFQIFWKLLPCHLLNLLFSKLGIPSSQLFLTELALQASVIFTHTSGPSLASS